MQLLSQVSKMPGRHKVLWAIVSLLRFALCWLPIFEVHGFREELTNPEGRAGDALSTLIAFSLALLCLSAGAGWFVHRSCIHSFRHFMGRLEDRYGHGLTLG